MPIEPDDIPGAIPRPSSADLRAPLRRPAFRRLGLSYAVNEMGDWLGLVALSVLVFDETGSVMATTLLFLATKFVPALIAPAIVTRAERPPPRLALPAIYLAEAVAFGLLALLALEFSLVLVLLLAVIDGALALTGRAVTRAVTASLLGPAGELRAGNAMLNLAFTGGAAIGPAIAGVVVAGFGVPVALLANAASFCAVAVLLFTTGRLPHPEIEPGRMRERLAAGFSYIRQRLALAQLLGAQAAAFIFFAAVIPVEVVYAKVTLDAGDTGYGILLASWGVGMVAGSLTFAALRRGSLALLLAASTAAVGIAYLGMAAAPSLLVACAAAVVGGTGNGVQWVSAISAVQEMTSEAMQARVMSVLESIGAAMPGVGFLIGGLIAATFEPRATFLVAGAGVIAVIAVAAPAISRTWEREGYAARART